MKARVRALAYALIMMLCVAVTQAAGKDLNWDLLNYHLYAGYSALHEGVRGGYFSASWQAYLNPWSHVPLYLMVQGGLAARLIGALLALFHALNLILLFEIAVLLCRRRSGQVVWWAVWLAVLLGFANPVFLQELGTSFNEVSTAVPVLAGWTLLVLAQRRLSFGALALAGALIGAAIGLKLTNVFFSVSALPLLLLLPASGGARWRAVLAFAAGGVSGVVLSMGWWSWQLWEQFHNPLFPMFNQLFHSPDFVPQALKHDRFIPTSWQQALLRPWAMLWPDPDIYTETMAPDLRYAALLLLPLLYAGKALLARGGALLLPFGHDRALLGLTLGLAVSWAMWLPASGNGRYFLPMSLLAAVVLAGWLVRLTENWRVLVYGGGVLVLLQGMQLMLGTAPRWAGVDWGAQWIELTVPAALKDKPSLHLVISENSSSFILPFLAPGSSFMSITGQIGLAPNARSGALMARYPGQVRALRPLMPLDGLQGQTLALMDFYLAPFALRVDRADCVTIRHRYGVQGSTQRPYRDYLSCATLALQWTEQQWADYRASKRVADRIFDRIEDLCPAQFAPRRMVSEGDGSGFIRHYVNTDTILYLEKGVVGYRHVYFHTPQSTIGPVEQLARALPTACPSAGPLRPAPR